VNRKRKRKLNSTHVEDEALVKERENVKVGVVNRNDQSLKNYLRLVPSVYSGTKTRLMASLQGRSKMNKDFCN
jgi:hypothetical protein